MTPRLALIPPQPRFTQRGITLLIVLVMLAVISLVSGASLRSALSAEHVTHNVRLENLAKEAAHLGLRYCENQLRQAEPELTVHPAAADGGAPLWTLWETWHGSHAQATTVPTEVMSSPDSAFAPATRPQCLLEAHPAHPELITVTARGFSPDHQANSAGHTTMGAVAWVQSVVRICVVDSASDSTTGPCQTMPLPTPEPMAESMADASPTPDAVVTPPPIRRIQSRVWRQLLSPPMP